jgi:excisionase family DNA binding protein
MSQKQLQMMVACPECGGAGVTGGELEAGEWDYHVSSCRHCGESGVVPGLCTCGRPAAEVVDGLAWCGEECPDELYAVTEICSECLGALPSNDRLPVADGTRAHVLCRLTLMAVPPASWAANLENAERTDTTDHTHERTYVRTNVPTNVRLGPVRAGGTMPKPSDKLLEKMRAKGFISADEAAEMTGHARSTIYDWVRKKRVEGLRSGALLFVERASVERRVVVVPSKAVAR